MEAKLAGVDINCSVVYVSNIYTLDIDEFAQDSYIPLVFWPEDKDGNIPKKLDMDNIVFCSLKVCDHFCMLAGIENHHSRAEKCVDIFCLYLDRPEFSISLNLIHRQTLGIPVFDVCKLAVILYCHNNKSFVSLSIRVDTPPRFVDIASYSYPKENSKEYQIAVTDQGMEFYSNR